MYFISRGKVEVSDRAGTVNVTREEGEFIGELSLIHRKPRTASVRALTRCDLFVLDKKDFDRALQDHPGFARTLQEAMSNRYTRAAETDN